MKTRLAALAVTASLSGLGLVVGQGIATTPMSASAAVVGATVTPFGDATDLGGLGGKQLAKPVAAAAPTPTHQGYWLASSDGGVYTFGDATFLGSAGASSLNEPIVGMASTPGAGYWLVARDGGIFAFGDATFLGSTGGSRLNQPIVGMTATPTGKGYWLVARDGGIFAYGDAQFFGSTGAIKLNQPIVGMAATPTGKGYTLVASDGGIFVYGDAEFFGSTGAIKLNQPITSMTTTASGRGYWLVARDGGVFAYGDAGFFGKVNLILPEWQVFSLLPTATGQGYWQVAGPDPQLPTLQRGDNGAAVAELQQQLQSLGYWLDDGAGAYGLTTEQAVIVFQKVQGLPRTGKFDGFTRTAFKAAARPTPRSATGDLVEVDKARQVIIIVRNGRAAWILNTSTGTETNYKFEGKTYLAHTPEGVWHVWSVVDGLQHGRLGDLFRPRYYTPDGVAVHGAEKVPAYPASHGCSRVTNDAINWIWANNLMPKGSTVWVY